MVGVNAAHVSTNCKRKTESTTSWKKAIRVGILLPSLRRSSSLVVRCRETGTAKRRKRMSSSQPQQVRASHLLIKHSGSRRKASWKDPEGNIIKNTSRDSAVAQLKSLREDVVAGKARFEDLASRYSDCSSAKRGGDLGPFGRGQMQKPFEEAAFSLKVGEISEIVYTDSGVHIIMRTG